MKGKQLCQLYLRIYESILIIQISCNLFTGTYNNNNMILKSVDFNLTYIEVYINL